jgi:hypothetical protein
MIIKPVITAIKSPNCNNCKYFRNYNNKPGVCTLFKYSTQIDIKSLNYYVEVEHCRKNPSLCGIDGTYFKVI